jgi:hypothetical protein
MLAPVYTLVIVVLLPCGNGIYPVEQVVAARLIGQPGGRRMLPAFGLPPTL